MSNTVAYLNIALETFIGFDPSQDPTAFIRLLEKYKYRYKLVEALRAGRKVLLETHQIPFRKSQKLCELQSGPYTKTKVITKMNYEVALDSDPTRIQDVHRNHLVEFFPRDNDLPTLSSNYEKPFNDDRSESSPKTDSPT